MSIFVLFSHDFKYASNFPYDVSISAAANFCRNPDMYTYDRPMCMTSDPDVPWEYCDIPECDGFNAGKYKLV